MPTDLSLDEAIRTALLNSEVVRVLAGVTAVSSGRTIYDAAITNTTIDQERARFDPTVSVTNSWDRTETPIADFDPLDPTRAIIGGIRVDDYDMQFDLTKTTATGGEFNFGVSDLTSPSSTGSVSAQSRESHVARPQLYTAVVARRRRGSQSSPNSSRADRY